MTPENKQLLLKDLCSRLPYHLRIHIYNDSWEGCRKGEFDNMMGFHHVEAFLCDRIEILPYLRSMSSMTEEEAKDVDLTEYLKGSFYVGIIDWLNEHHFDYRGLIPMGLALEAKEGMYKTE